MRTEDDLKAAYTEPLGIEGAERRLIDSMSATRVAARAARARRRTWAAGGAGVAVIAVALGTAIVARGGDTQPGARHDGHAATRTSATAAARPATSPGGTPERVTITPQVLLRTAVDLLPRRGHTSRYAGNFGTGFVGARFVYDDGHGAAQVFVAITFPADGRSRVDNGGVAPCAVGSVGCAVLSDGAHAQFRQGHDYSDGRTPNALERDLDLVRPDGVQISLDEWNAPQPKDAALTRSRPPFTRAELTTWADSSEWQTQVSAERARAVAHLFHADDLNAPPQDNTSAQQSHRP